MRWIKRATWWDHRVLGYNTYGVYQKLILQSSVWTLLLFEKWLPLHQKHRVSSEDKISLLLDHGVPHFCVVSFLPQDTKWGELKLVSLDWIPRVEAFLSLLGTVRSPLCFCLVLPSRDHAKVWSQWSCSTFPQQTPYAALRPQCLSHLCSLRLWLLPHSIPTSLSCPLSLTR